MLCEVAHDELVVDALLERASHALPRQRAHEGIGQHHIAPHKLPEDGDFQGRGSVSHHLQECSLSGNARRTCAVDFQLCQFCNANKSLEICSGLLIQLK